jgi:TetR/AcrR family transcriptional regulator, lmrAB and yxaGH operons repressor
MPAPLMTKETVLERLMKAFRDNGYDGASLTELSTATGLGKSSLYHHFPGGKVDMAEQVLAHLDATLEAAVFAPLRSKVPPEKKLGAMLDTISTFYDGGKRACLLERLSASVDRARFRRPLANAFAKWVDAVEALGIEANVPKPVARARAEDLVIRIEGALVVCAGTGDTKLFERTIADLRSSVLSPTSGRRQIPHGRNAS